MTPLTDYTDRCGSCKFFKPAYSNGRITKSGRCHKRQYISKHRASDKACLQYFEDDQNKGE